MKFNKHLHWSKTTPSLLNTYLFILLTKPTNVFPKLILKMVQINSAPFHWLLSYLILETKKTVYYTNATPPAGTFLIVITYNYFFNLGWAVPFHRFTTFWKLFSLLIAEIILKHLNKITKIDAVGRRRLRWIPNFRIYRKYNRLHLLDPTIRSIRPTK